MFQFVHPRDPRNTMHNCSTRLFKQSKVKLRSTRTRYWRSTRFFQKGRWGWTYLCAAWCQCQLFAQLSKLTSWKWKMCSKWGIKKGTKFSTYPLQIGRERKIPLMKMSPHEMFISRWRMRDSSPFWWWI